MLKAIIIDSNATSRGLLQTILANNGWEVVGHTSSNSKGLLLLKQFEPNFVCIDAQLIGDETDILESIRKEWPKTLIFMTSSALDKETAERAAAKGVHGFFIKPFNQATVAATVRNAVMRLVKSQQKSA